MMAAPALLGGDRFGGSAGVAEHLGGRNRQEGPVQAAKLKRSKGRNYNRRGKGREALSPLPNLPAEPFLLSAVPTGLSHSNAEKKGGPSQHELWGDTTVVSTGHKHGPTTQN